MHAQGIDRYLAEMGARSEVDRRNGRYSHWLLGELGDIELETGVAKVDVVLLGLAERSESRRSVVLLPRMRVLATEALAYILPQNDSRWRDLVNRMLIEMFVDVQVSNSRYEEIYNCWFGRGGAQFFPLHRATATTWAVSRSEPGDRPDVRL